MHKLVIGSLPIPDIYICESGKEAQQAKQMGIPYLVRPKGFNDELLAKIVLLNTLKRKFPGINWRRFFGSKIYDHEEILIQVPGGEATCHDDPIPEGNVSVVDQATEERTFSGGSEDPYDYAERDIERYVGDLSAYVNIEELQDLGMLPTFLDDTAEAVKRNLFNIFWTEGYNKKRGCPVGNFDAGDELPNLIILDVSGSIPRGVSATMLTLLETLKEQANAAVIVTGSRSMFWDVDDKLPDPDWIRNRIGFGNEADQFYKILTEHIGGKHWGNVIVFGDYDEPAFYRDILSTPNPKINGTEVDKLWSYHTCKQKTPGYGKWCHDVDLHDEVINTEWCRYMK